MVVLVITLAEIKRQCAIGDTSQDADITALLAAEQLAHEYALDPGILALAVASGGDAGLLATLTLGVGEVLAGDYLQTAARAGSLVGFRVSSLAFTIAPGQTPGQLGSGLTKQGLARLAPFTRSARSRTAGAAGLTPDDYAPIPLMIGAQLAGSGPPPPSVFDGILSDQGNQGIQVSSYAGWDGDASIPSLWSTPEP